MILMLSAHVVEVNLKYRISFFLTLICMFSCSASSDYSNELTMEYLEILKSIELRNDNVNDFRLNNIPLIANYLIDAKVPSDIVLSQFESLNGDYESVFDYVNAMCQKNRIRAIRYLVEKGMEFSTVRKSNIEHSPSHCLVIALETANVELFKYVLFEGQRIHGALFTDHEFLEYINVRKSYLEDILHD